MTLALKPTRQTGLLVFSVVLALFLNEGRVEPSNKNLRREIVRDLGEERSALTTIYSLPEVGARRTIEGLDSFMRSAESGEPDLANHNIRHVDRLLLEPTSQED